MTCGSNYFGQLGNNTITGTTDTLVTMINSVIIEETYSLIPI